MAPAGQHVGSIVPGMCQLCQAVPHNHSTAERLLQRLREKAAQAPLGSPHFTTVPVNWLALCLPLQL